MFSGVPTIGDKTKSGYITPAFSRAQKWAELLRKPCVLGGPGVPGIGDKIRSGYITLAHKLAELLREPYILGDPWAQDEMTKSE